MGAPPAKVQAADAAGTAGTAGEDALGPLQGPLDGPMESPLDPAIAIYIIDS